MGRIRGGLRAYPLDSADPADVLDRLDANLRHFEPDRWLRLPHQLRCRPGGHRCPGTRRRPAGSRQSAGPGGTTGAGRSRSDRMPLRWPDGAGH
ncbi:MAG: hypothetical protein ACLQDY_26255 [Streptosporangiaceae bacterium]